MTATYTPIATYTAPSAQSSYTFTSIPSTYTDLVIVCSVIGTGNAQLQLRYNGDTASNYSFTILSGNGTDDESDRGVNQTKILTDYYFSVNTAGGMVVINVMNYSNTTTYKTAIMRANNAATATMANVGLWRNTAAITSIDISTSLNQFAAGTTFTLYGIEAA